MTDITYRCDFDVELVTNIGSDKLICQAARVSTLGAASIDSKESAGLIKFLMSNRHGSPFEHGMITFRISAPIFVWREFMRHRIGVSYNEQSGRYMEFEPVFYVCDANRNLIQTGKPGHYIFSQGELETCLYVNRMLIHLYIESWETYQALLKFEIAKEVSRFCLPVGIYSTAYVTMNPRSLMHFLSLRVKDPASTFPSNPQWEINQVANQIEEIFADKFPITHEAFVSSGRVCP
jgi:flavin-dependent thymidylate synthase